MNTNRTRLNTDHKEGKCRVLTEGIIKVFYKVYNTLGYGFLEKVYENSLIIELKKAGIAAVPQTPIKVLYDGDVVGECFADILVEGKVIVEIKAAKALAPDHEAQLLNYLKATDIEVGLLLNVGAQPEVKRKVLDNYRK
jgi:GxxExxY protein